MAPTSGMSAWEFLASPSKPGAFSSKFLSLIVYLVWVIPTFSEDSEALRLATISLWVFIVLKTIEDLLEILILRRSPGSGEPAEPLVHPADEAPTPTEPKAPTE